ncbi:MAG: PilW family protein [Candidatus Methylomirabilales bacterium]
MMGNMSTNKGFTILEALIFSAIFGIVVTAIYMMYSTSHTTFTRGQNRIDLQQNGRVAMEVMAREIRTSGYDPSNPPNGVIPGLATNPQNCVTPGGPGPYGPYAVQIACDNYIRFIADVDGNGTTDQVTYRLQGTQVLRDFSSWNGATFPPPASSILADFVGAVAFEYWDGGNGQLFAPLSAADLSNLRRITIQLTTQTDETLHGTATQQASFPLSMDVRLRNL